MSPILAVAFGFAATAIGIYFIVSAVCAAAQAMLAFQIHSKGENS